MTRISVRAFSLALAAIAGGSGLFVDERISQSRSFVTSAHAVIGRPLTPMSYAGVARRSAVGVGVVGAPVVVVPAPVVVAPVCAQVVNVYGQIATVCR